MGVGRWTDLVLFGIWSITLFFVIVIFNTYQVQPPFPPSPKKKMSDNDSDSDDWCTEELEIPSQTKNLKDERTKNEDDDWEIKLDKKNINI